MVRRLVPGTFVALTALALYACSSDPSPAPGEDAGLGDDAAAPREADASEEGDAAAPGAEDAGPERDGSKPPGEACVGPIVSGEGEGETCIGFGAAPETCDPSCGQAFGYVCYGGAPPGFTGCREQGVSAFGSTYCCPTNACVAQPDRDVDCPDASRPRRFQCPPEGDGHVAAPSGCVETGSGASELEKFYCCP